MPGHLITRGVVARRSAGVRTPAACSGHERRCRSRSSGAILARTPSVTDDLLVAPDGSLASRKAHPPPAPTGQVADKAFFDWLCGEEAWMRCARRPMWYGSTPATSPALHSVQYPVLHRRRRSRPGITSPNTSGAISSAISTVVSLSMTIAVQFKRPDSGSWTSPQSGYWLTRISQNHKVVEYRSDPATDMEERYIGH
jgi:hypothetical protein